MKKLDKQIVTIITAAGILFCSSVTALANNYSGQLETVSDTEITGWAKDKNSADTPVKVSIAIIPEGSSEAAKETTLYASKYRNSSEYAPSTAGYCGFTWDVDWSNMDNGTYLIQMQSGTKKVTRTLSYTNTAGIETAAAEEIPAAAQEVQSGIQSLGVFKTTAYCPCYSCSGGWGRKTSTGATAKARHTVAVDPRVIPYGSKLLIDGIVYTAEDRGGGVKGNHIDIFFDTHSETRRHGVSYKEIYLMQ